MASGNISECARERETFLHDPTLLLSDIKYNDTGELKSTLGLSTTTDPILTALAQLGACRTGASRAFISLFDKAHQYTIAEATQTSSLRCDLGKDGTPCGPFWLRGTAIPRRSGLYQRFLNTKKSVEDGRDASLPVNVIPDIRADPYVSEDTCVLLASPCRGWVGVPIRSRNGVDFGEYCVVTEEPIHKEEWCDANSRLLRELSVSVRDHLLSKASHLEKERAEKKTRGIGLFVEQRSTMLSSRNTSTHDTDNGKPIEKRAAETREKTAHSFEDISLRSTRSTPQLCQIAGGPSQLPHPASIGESPAGGSMSTNRLLDVNSSRTVLPLQRNPAPIETDPLTIVFSKAAEIIRGSIDADGVVFFDASAGSFNCSSQKFTGSDASKYTSSQDESWSSEETDTESDGMHNDIHIIASSTSKTPTVERDAYISDRKRMSFKALSALLRRYPKGTVFDYDENGKLQPYNSSDCNSRPLANTNSKSPMLTKRRTSSFIGNLGNEVSKAFPGARSVAFVPVWDQIKKRWCAGCFAYTRDRTRFFCKKGDISYLCAFATLAMAEIASLETHLTSQAQSDVLGSLSHELRSPLHGIILGVEFLADTPLSVFQGNLLHILETCGRTLSDTIDHLLFYAKVNNFIPPGKTPDSRARGLRKEMNYTLQAGMKSITAPVQVDVLVEEVTESIFAGFNFQRLSVGQLERDQRKSHADIYAIRQNDNLQATEDLGHLLIEEGGELKIPSKNIVVDLAIDHRYSHHYYAISGAVRRIVMNLFGNALKFTSSGSIRVALSQEALHSKKFRNTNFRCAKIVVSDTGKGITEDFLVNHLFEEFQQEHVISPGLGLGLSVVKKIVSSLRGKVCIESQVGVGTTATVLLPLQPVANLSGLPEAHEVELDDYAEHRRQLKGLRVCFVGFDAPLRLPNSKNPVDDYRSIWNVCRKDLAMEVISTTQARNLVPDIVLCEEEALYDPFLTREGLCGTPHVVVCVNALSAYRLSTEPRFQDSCNITEFISQPTGPRKLAKILVAALQRWVERQDQSKMLDHQAHLTMHPVSSMSHSKPDALNPVYGGDLPNTPPKRGSGPFELSGIYQSRPRPRSPSLSPRSSPLPIRTQSVSPQGHVPHFLLVEDNAINMKILCAYMKKLGRSYATAEDGQVAVDKYREKPGYFDCLLMDINMPRLDGLQATRQIREFEADQHLPPSTVITLSGLASASVQQEAFNSGVDLFLTKPVKLQEISETLRSRDLM
ncbi:hypothetical protein FHL15_003443 [Xylaria flabelliformis]|uniref:Histidine kinase n=1 Tax=Xylaria flabelliformis TaxID=2512241 RepID=A0A553I5K7_9PEZI|nr:hypothetical protein FHL15_003443 [Xylaria flabelliformis]